MKEVLHVAFEYKKGVGGLKSVINGLLPSLATKNKYNVSVVTPYYKFFTEDDLKAVSRITSIKHIHQKEIYTSDVYLCVDSTEEGTVNHYLIKPEVGSPVGMIFDIDDEKNIYQGFEHSEPLYRFSYFNGAVASLVRFSQGDFIPEFDIVHTHAWQTALGVCLIKEYETLSRFEELRATVPYTSLRKAPYIVNTIHILSEHECGLLHDHHLETLFRSVGLPRNFESKFNKFNQHINPKATKQLALGLLYCDQVTIVSQGLVKDVLNGKGCGIDDIFKKLNAEDRLLGINNGINFERWDATSSKVLGKNFLKPDTPLEGKLTLKRELVKSFTGLNAGKKWFLFVGRFSEEKGIDMLQHALKAIQQIEANFIIMGVYTVAGNSLGANSIKQLIDSFKNIQNVLVIDDEKIQKDFGMQIRAASDFTIVPSHMEACGLVPMEAMACASIPIISDVQGLPDSVLKLDQNISTGTGFIYSDDAKTRNEAIKHAIIQAHYIYNDLLDKKELDKILARILKHSKRFDWKQSVVENYISLYEKLSSKQLVKPCYERIQAKDPLKPSTALHAFLHTYGFDLDNLNKVNKHGSTPLTVAIDKNMLDIAKELLSFGTNPILPNCHGNTPMWIVDRHPEVLADISFIKTLSTDIKAFTISELREEINQIIDIKGCQYKVEKIIKTGSCSISVLELTYELSKKQFILKVNSKFGGYETRNHILLDAFSDLLNIDIFIKDNGDTRRNVQGLLQPLVPGVTLNDYFIQNSGRQEEIDRVIGITIIALNKLHVEKNSVHKDALPGNALYNISTDTVTFIDLATLRTKYDKDINDFELEKTNDFKRLLFGDERESKGLKDFSNNMQQIISRIADQNLQFICNKIFGFPNKEPSNTEDPIFHESNNPISILHVALEYGQAVLGGLGMVTTQMVKAQSSFVNTNGHCTNAGIITPFYPKLYTESIVTKIATVTHLYEDKQEISNILFCSINKHYMVQPTAKHADMFNISTVHGIYNNDTSSSFINKILYFNSAVAAYITLGETLQDHSSPQIIQLHDWTVALVSELLIQVYKYNKSRVLFVVHIDNLDHGAYTYDALQGVGLKFPSATQILKAIGIKNADMIVTVSPSFLQECLNNKSQNSNVEILRKLFVVANARKKVIGIANGFDYAKYYPSEFLIGDKSNIFIDKLKIKTELARCLNGSRSVWKIDPNLPLILYIGRYSPEKGVETFKLLIDSISSKAIFIAIGRGFERNVFDVINAYSRQMNNIFITFSESEQAQYLPMARAGAEFMFIPSHREADGLVIKEGFANGCLAITSGIGGLKDSAVPFDDTDPEQTRGNSFIYEDCNNDSLTRNVKQSLLIWSNFDQCQKSKVHRRLMDEAKKHDWGASDGPLKKYDEIYQKTCKAGSNSKHDPKMY